MKKISFSNAHGVRRLTGAALLLAVWVAVPTFAQETSKQPLTPARPVSSGVARVGAGEASVPAVPAGTEDAIDPVFKKAYRDFYDTYRLGPADELAVRVLGQPDYSLEKAKISPVGRLYHPLLGDVEVAGLTVEQLSQKLTQDLSQFVLNPKVSVALLEANSAKVGVLGDVASPGIVVMTKPMTVLDALSASGGVSDFGNKSNVTVLRQTGYDRPVLVKVNVKRILEGKAGPEENIRLQAGDTVIVHGNTLKKLSQLTSLFGFGNFLMFLINQGR